MSLFEVDVKGFKSLMKIKPKWHFVRELISNSLDEISVTDINVKLQKEPRWLLMEVVDDGNGFERLSDAYTLFAHTKKRSDATVRGRFNMGEKELASISKEMIIETTSGKVVFKDGKRKDHPRTKRDQGTRVFAKIKCSNEEFGEVLNMLYIFLIPSGKNVHLDWSDESPHGFKDGCEDHVSFYGSDESDWSVEEILETVLFDKETGGMRSTKRKTKVDIHKTHLPINVMSGSFRDPENRYGLRDQPIQAYLYELGIPVQPIDCKYSVNVNQKIPMNANRDSVKDSYLRDIYALVLNQTHNDLYEDEVSEGWVKVASEDDLVSDDAFKSLQKKRYGDKAVMWSSDLQANEDAIDQGYTVIHGKTMSKTERNRFQKVGMISSAKKFERGVAPSKYIKPSDWTHSMETLSILTKDYAHLIRVASPNVKFISSPQASTVASYQPRLHMITFNVDKIGGKDFDPYDQEVLATMVHEFAHMNMLSNPDQIQLHGKDFYDLMAQHGAKVFAKYISEIVKNNKGGAS